MRTVSSAIDIDAPPEQVWAVLTDLAAYLTGRPAPGLRAAPVLPAWL